MTDRTPDDIPLLTVGELMARLKACDPATVVAIKCEDSYYSGPVAFETYMGSVAWIAPHDWVSPVDRLQQRYRGGWQLVDEDDERLDHEQKRIPAFILMDGI